MNSASGYPLEPHVRPHRTTPTPTGSGAEDYSTTRGREDARPVSSRSISSTRKPASSTRSFVDHYERRCRDPSARIMRISPEDTRNASSPKTSHLIDSCGQRANESRAERLQARKPPRAEARAGQANLLPSLAIEEPPRGSRPCARRMRGSAPSLVWRHGADKPHAVVYEGPSGLAPVGLPKGIA